MVVEYGMSDRLGLVTYESSRQAMFPPAGYNAGKTYSETRATEIDQEISRVVDEAHTRVQKILKEREKVLHELAALLSQNEVVQGDELRKMLSQFTQLQPAEKAFPQDKRGL